MGLLLHARWTTMDMTIEIYTVMATAYTGYGRSPAAVSRDHGEQSHCNGGGALTDDVTLGTGPLWEGLRSWSEGTGKGCGAKQDGAPRSLSIHTRSCRERV